MNTADDPRLALIPMQDMRGWLADARASGALTPEMERAAEALQRLYPEGVRFIDAEADVRLERALTASVVLGGRRIDWESIIDRLQGTVVEQVIGSGVRIVTTSVLIAIFRELSLTPYQIALATLLYLSMTTAEKARASTERADARSDAKPRRRLSRTAVKRPAQIYISYSCEDKEHLNQLLSSLAMLKRQGIISIWHKRRLAAGDARNTKISKYLEAADIILLLVSSDFLASDARWELEIKRAMERHEFGEARVVPIYVRDCDWSLAPFSQLQGVPDPTTPIARARNRDAAWTAVVGAIRAIVEPSASSRDERE